MLVYVKKSEINDVLGNVLAEDIPAHLKVRFENERQRDIQRKKEKDEAGLFCEVLVCFFKKHLVLKIPNDLFEKKNFLIYSNFFRLFRITN